MQGMVQLPQAAAEGGALSTRHAKPQPRGALPPLREANGPAAERVKPMTPLFS